MGFIIFFKNSRITCKMQPIDRVAKHTHRTKAQMHEFFYETETWFSSNWNQSAQRHR